MHFALPFRVSGMFLGIANELFFYHSTINTANGLFTILIYFTNTMGIVCLQRLDVVMHVNPIRSLAPCVFPFHYLDPTIIVVLCCHVIRRSSVEICRFMSSTKKVLLFPWNLKFNVLIKTSGTKLYAKYK